MFPESDLIPVSALQHFLFCPRQYALIHIERQWEENERTANGRNLHERAHGEKSETRPDCKRIFGMPVRSLELGISGQCDCVLETPEGAFIPLEYKRGKPKTREMDTVQLCAQALCLEEMTGRTIEEGYIYYFGVRKRLRVALDSSLRDLTRKTVRDTRALYESGKTPAPLYSKKCDSCSLKDICLPELIGKRKLVNAYIKRLLVTEPKGD